MRKYIPIITLLLGALGYIGVTQIFFKNKHFDFKEVYVADKIEVELVNQEKGLVTAKEQYQENDKYFIEIIETDEVKLTLTGDEIWIDGVRSESNAVIYVKGKSILLETKAEIIIAPKNVKYEKVNENTAIDKVKIGIGGIIGIALALLITSKTLPPKLKVSLSLGVVTVLVFFMSQILHEMFWTLVWANIGWYGGLGGTSIRTKEQKKLQQFAQEVVRSYGSV